MEGIGYWIFLMLLYFISGLMKKRKNKSIFKEMEKKDYPYKSKIEGILDYLNFDSESDSESEQEYEETIWTSGEKEEEAIEYISEIENDSLSEVHIPINSTIKENLRPISKPYKKGIGVKLNSSYIKKKILFSETEIKKAIILKEIFDKPMALRNTLR